MTNTFGSALNFYKDTLGLEIDDQGEMGFSITLGESSYFVYPKKDHQPATFTILNFEVQDIRKTVETLKSAGVRFKSYGGDIKTDDDNIHRGEGPVIAWFADPCGNILSVIEKRSLQH